MNDNSIKICFIALMIAIVEVAALATGHNGDMLRMSMLILGALGGVGGGFALANYKNTETVIDQEELEQELLRDRSGLGTGLEKKP